MDEHNLPNTFITDEGDVIFCNAWEWTKSELRTIESLKIFVDSVEKKFGKSIDEMMLSGINRKLLFKYIDARHDLLMFGAL